MSASKAKKPKRPKLLGSRELLAKRLKVSRQTIQNWSKHSEWPFQKGPYDPGKVKAWSEKHLRRPQNNNSKSESVNGRDPGKAEADRIHRLKQTEHLDLKIQKERGLMILRVDHHESMLALAHIFVSETNNWIQTMPNQLQHKDAIEIEKWASERLDTLRARLAMQIGNRNQGNGTSNGT